MVWPEASDWFDSEALVLAPPTTNPASSLAATFTPHSEQAWSTHSQLSSVLLNCCCCYSALPTPPLLPWSKRIFTPLEPPPKTWKANQRKRTCVIIMCSIISCVFVQIYYLIIQFFQNWTFLKLFNEDLNFLSFLSICANSVPLSISMCQT